MLSSVGSAAGLREKRGQLQICFVIITLIQVVPEVDHLTSQKLKVITYAVMPTHTYQMGHLKETIWSLISRG